MCVCESEKEERKRERVRGREEERVCVVCAPPVLLAAYLLTPA